MSRPSELERVRALVEPIASDLQLDLYDVERRGGTVRITLDTRPGSEGGITLDSLSLATRLISRELDHADPIAGHYTLEVTSPGLERPLRLPAHYRREVGKPVLVRLRDTAAEERRVEGVLTAADDHGFVVTGTDGTDRRVEYAAVDKARTVFEWDTKDKPGRARKQPAAPQPVTAQSATSQSATSQSATSQSKEKQPS